MLILWSKYCKVKLLLKMWILFLSFFNIFCHACEYVFKIHCKLPDPCNVSLVSAAPWWFWETATEVLLLKIWPKKYVAFEMTHHLFTGALALYSDSWHPYCKLDCARPTGWKVQRQPGENICTVMLKFHKIFTNLFHKDAG